MMQYLVFGILGIICLAVSKMINSMGSISNIVVRVLIVVGWVALAYSVVGMLSKNTGFLKLL